MLIPLVLHVRPDAVGTLCPVMLWKFETVHIHVCVCGHVVAILSRIFAERMALYYVKQQVKHFIELHKILTYMPFVEARCSRDPLPYSSPHTLLISMM